MRTEHRFLTKPEAEAFVVGVRFVNDSALAVSDPVYMPSLEEPAWLVITEEIE